MNRWKILAAVVSVVAASSMLAGSSEDTAVYYEPFDTPQSGWLTYMGDTLSLGYSSASGCYRIELAQPLCTTSWAPIAEDLPDSLIITTQVRASGSANYRVGLAWGENKQDYYWFYVSSSETYGVLHFSDGSWQTPAVVPPTISAEIQSDVPNALELRIRRSSIQLLVNDSLLQEVSTAKPTPSRVGLVASTSSAGQTYFDFDWFEVAELSVDSTGSSSSDWRNPPREQAIAAAEWGDLQAQQGGDVFSPWEVRLPDEPACCAPNVVVGTPLHEIAWAAYYSRTQDGVALESSAIDEGLETYRNELSCLVMLCGDVMNFNLDYSAVLRQGLLLIPPYYTHYIDMKDEDTCEDNYVGWMVYYFEAVQLDPSQPFALVVTGLDSELEFPIDISSLGPGEFR